MDMWCNAGVLRYVQKYQAYKYSGTATLHGLLLLQAYENSGGRKKKKSDGRHACLQGPPAQATGFTSGQRIGTSQIS